MKDETMEALEPVAWMYELDGEVWVQTEREPDLNIFDVEPTETPLYTRPSPSATADFGETYPMDFGTTAAVEEVTQEDREAASALALVVYGTRIASRIADRTIERHHFLDAFRDHRLAALRSTQPAAPAAVGDEAHPLVQAIADWETDHGTLAGIVPCEYPAFMDLLKAAAVKGSARATLQEEPHHG